MVIETMENKGKDLSDLREGFSSSTSDAEEEIYDPKWPKGNGSRRIIKPAPTPNEINWDLRPKGDPGNKEGAAHRDLARLERLVDAGDVAYADEAFEGSGTIVELQNGVEVEVNVIAAIPIPANEMIRFSGATGVVTPLWPEGQAHFFLGDNQPKPTQE